MFSATGEDLVYQFAVRLPIALFAYPQCSPCSRHSRTESTLVPELTSGETPKNTVPMAPAWLDTAGSPDVTRRLCAWLVLPFWARPAPARPGWAVS